MSIRFDQRLWDARSEGYRSEDSDANPYLATSPAWAAWNAGRAFGLGRVSTSRGSSLNLQIDGRDHRLTYDQITEALAGGRKIASITYQAMYQPGYGR